MLHNLLMATFKAISIVGNSHAWKKSRW